MEASSNFHSTPSSMFVPPTNIPPRAIPPVAPTLPGGIQVSCQGGSGSINLSLDPSKSTLSTVALQKHILAELSKQRSINPPLTLGGNLSESHVVAVRDETKLQPMTDSRGWVSRGERNAQGDRKTEDAPIKVEEYTHNWEKFAKINYEFTMTVKDGNNTYTITYQQPRFTNIKIPVGKEDTPRARQEFAQKIASCEVAMQMALPKAGSNVTKQKREHLLNQLMNKTETQHTLSFDTSRQSYFFGHTVGVTGSDRRSFDYLQMEGELGTVDMRKKTRTPVSYEEFEKTDQQDTVLGKAAKLATPNQQPLPSSPLADFCDTTNVGKKNNLLSRLVANCQEFVDDIKASQHAAAILNDKFKVAQKKLTYTPEGQGAHGPLGTEMQKYEKNQDLKDYIKPRDDNDKDLQKRKGDLCKRAAQASQDLLKTPSSVEAQAWNKTVSLRDQMLKYEELEKQKKKGDEKMGRVTARYAQEADFIIDRFTKLTNNLAIIKYFTDNQKVTSTQLQQDLKKLQETLSKEGFVSPDIQTASPAQKAASDILDSIDQIVPLITQSTTQQPIYQKRQDIIAAASLNKFMPSFDAVLPKPPAVSGASSAPSTTTTPSTSSSSAPPPVATGGVAQQQPPPQSPNPTPPVPVATTPATPTPPTLNVGQATTTPSTSSSSVPPSGTPGGGSQQSTTTNPP
jgi:hypothetical protein